MATPSVHQGDFHVTGNLTAGGGIGIPANTIVDAQVAPSAGIQASKVIQQKHGREVQSGNATAVTKPIHVAYGAGTVVAVRVGSVVAATGDSTATIDVKKNGTTILSGAVVLDNANTAYISEAGTISVPSYDAGDVFTAVVTVSAGSGTLPTGLFVDVAFNEEGAP